MCPQSVLKEKHVYRLLNKSQFDLNRLIGRLRSTSYALTPAKGYQQMIADITALYNQHHVEGQAVFPYLTRLYLRKLDVTASIFSRYLRSCPKPIPEVKSN
jgi:hypothetical protein